MRRKKEVLMESKRWKKCKKMIKILSCSAKGIKQRDWYIRKFEKGG